MKALIAVATILLFVPHSILPGQGQGQPRAVSIDELVAPIALYPDALIAQILLSAANPAQVQEFDRWLTANNQAASGQNLQDAAVKAGFEASLVALALFPQVIKQMASDLNWTKTLGATFAANQESDLRQHPEVAAPGAVRGDVEDDPAAGGDDPGDLVW